MSRVAYDRCGGRRTTPFHFSARRRRRTPNLIQFLKRNAFMPRVQLPQQIKTHTHKTWTIIRSPSVGVCATRLLNSASTMVLYIHKYTAATQHIKYVKYLRHVNKQKDYWKKWLELFRSAVPYILQSNRLFFGTLVEAEIMRSTKQRWGIYLSKMHKIFELLEFFEFIFL